MLVPRIVATDGSGERSRYRQNAARLWFGRVDSQSNDHDVRVGYDDDYLMADAAVSCRKIYDETAHGALDGWDALPAWRRLSPRARQG